MNTYQIESIIPAPGWLAIFAWRHADGAVHVETAPLVAWGVEVRDFERRVVPLVVMTTE